jgi:hypothetical protein
MMSTANKILNNEAVYMALSFLHATITVTSPRNKRTIAAPLVSCSSFSDIVSFSNYTKAYEGRFVNNELETMRRDAALAS